MPRSYKGYPDASHVIPVEEASGLVGDPGVVFVDTRNFWKYAKGHIPGAVDLELYAFHWVDTSKEGMEAFAKEMAGLFGSFGIDRKKTVVFYQNNSGYDAARGVWLLEMLGNPNGLLLDGGLNKWRRAGLRVTTDQTDYHRAEFSPKLRDDVVEDLPGLEGHMRTRDATILDVRNPGEYSGVYRRALKAGHVPGSVNVEWSRALRRDGTLKDAAQLRGLYGSVPKGEEVVTYCQSGYRAAHTWLVLGLLGYDRVRNYPGSWYEWGNAKGAPVSTGKA